jgi:c-di-GMP-binding flagellar brake protein YcgR
MILKRKKAKERRKYKRMNYYCLLRYCPFGAKGQMARAITSMRNISGGGLLFKTDESFDVNTKLDMMINVPLLNKVISVTARIARSTRPKGGKGYLVGVEFLDIDKKDKEALIDLTDKTRG